MRVNRDAAPVQDVEIRYRYQQKQNVYEVVPFRFATRGYLAQKVDDEDDTHDKLQPQVPLRVGSVVARQHFDRYSDHQSDARDQTYQFHPIALSNHSIKILGALSQMLCRRKIKFGRNFFAKHFA